MSKIAIILNGDSEGRHISNVTHAADCAQKMGYETYVASPKRPSNISGDHYVTPTSGQVHALIQKLKMRHAGP
jgi:hypothetical protein